MLVTLKLDFPELMKVAMPGREQAVTLTRAVPWSCFQTSLTSLSKGKHNQSETAVKLNFLKKYWNLFIGYYNLGRN